MDKKKDRADLLDHLQPRGYKGDSTWHRYCLVECCENPSTGHFCFLHWRQINKSDQRKLKVIPSERMSPGHVETIRKILRENKFEPVYQLETIENYN